MADDIRYYDEDTGLLLTPDQVDLNQYDIVGESYSPAIQDNQSNDFQPADSGVQQNQPESNWLDVIGNSIGAVPYQIGKSVAGGLSSIEDSPIGGGVNWLEDKLGLGANFGQRTHDLATQYVMPAINEATKTNPNSAKDITKNVLSGMLPIAPALISGVGTIPTLATIGSQIAGDKYGDYKDAGATPGEAATGALVNAGIQMGVNAFPVSRAFNPGAGVINKAVTSGLSNAILNPIGTAGDIITTGRVTGNVPEPQQIADALTGSAITGLATGVGMGATEGLAGKFSGRANVAPETTQLNDFLAKVDQANKEAMPVPPAQADIPLKSSVSPETPQNLPDRVGEPVLPPQEAQAPLADNVPKPVDPVKVEADTNAKQSIDILNKDYQEQIAKTTNPEEQKQLEFDFNKSSQKIQEANQRIQEGNGTLLDSLRTKVSKISQDQGGWIGRKDPNKIDDAFDETMGQITKKKLPPGTEFFSGILGGYHEAFTLPRTMAEKFPDFKIGHDAWIDSTKTSALTIDDLRNTMSDYFDLKDKSKVNMALEAARIKNASFNETPEGLTKLGLDPVEIKAYNAVRAGMNTSLDYLERALTAKANNYANPSEYISKVQDYVSGLRSQKYVPFGRTGDFYAHALGKDGNTIEFSLHKSQSEANAASKLLAKKGYNVETGKLNRPTKAAYELMPGDMAHGLSFLDSALQGERSTTEPISGFKGHLEPAKLTPGYEKNFELSLASYIAGLGNFVSQAEATPKYRQMLETIRNNKDYKLLDYASKYVNDIQSPGSKTNQIVNTILYHNYLGFNIKSAALNLTQPLTVTYPILGQYVKNPARVLANSFAKTTRYLSARESFIKSNPELAQGIDIARRNGTIGNDAIEQMMSIKKGQGAVTKTLSEASSLFFNKAEHLNRLTSYIAGFDAATKKGLAGEARHAFAEDLVNDSQFRYGVGDKPQLARNKLLAPAFTFRLWQGNYLRQLFKGIEKRDLPFLARLTLPMIGLTGATGAPFAGSIIKAFETAGYDVKKELKEKVGNRIANLILNGLPSLAGVNISGALGLGNVAPDFQEGLAPAIGRLVGGVALDLPQRGLKAYDLAANKREVGRAFETMLPSSPQQLTKAYRYATEGNKNADGKTILGKDKYSPFDIGLTAIGFQSMKNTEAQDLSNSAYMLEKRVKSQNAKYNSLAAKYLSSNSMPDFQSLMKEIQTKNQNRPIEEQIILNKQSIKNKVKQNMMTPEELRIYKAPKQIRGAIADMNSDSED